MKHIDIDTITTFMGGDKQVLDNFLLLVRKELVNSLGDIENHFKEKNIKALKEAGHKLKGTALSGGLPVLATITAGFSNIAGYTDEQLFELLSKLKNEILHIISLLDKGEFD